jgi:hypothetical protein
MTGMDLFDYLIGKFSEQEAVVAQHLVAGKASGIEEYKRLCGLVEGLTFAKEIVKDVKKRQEEGAE